jgi:hypothetical protein
MVNEGSGETCLKKLAEHRVDGLIIIRSSLCEDWLSMLHEYANREHHRYPSRDMRHHTFLLLFSLHLNQVMNVNINTMILIGYFLGRIC